MNVAGGDLNWIATLNNSQFQNSIRQMEQSVSRSTTSILNQGNQLEQYAMRATETIGAFFSIQAASGFISSLVQVRSEFQQLDIAFTTMLKSKAASDKLMKELVSFASTTPFGLKDAAGAAKQLLAYGSTAKNVISELRMLGDVASGVSAPIGDLVYLYGTLKTQGRAYAMDIRQFAGRGIPIYAELAKVLGVAKGEVSGLVEAGKVGFSEVEQAFKNMTTSAGMFGGLMEAQSATLTGQIERLKDAWDVMLNQIGQSQDGVLAGSISLAADLVNNYDKVLGSLAAIIAMYGAYKGALVALSVIEMSTNLIREVTIINQARITTMQKLTVLWIAIETKARLALNAVMMANPYALVAAAVVGLGVAIYALNDNVTAQERAMKQLNDENELAARHAEDLKVKVSSLTNVLKDKTATDFQQSKAYAELQTLYPTIFSNLTKEAYLKLAAADAQQKINDANDKMTVEDIGQRYRKAQADVTELTNSIEQYKLAQKDAQDTSGSLGKSIDDAKSALEVATIKAEQLGSEFRQQKADLDFSLLSEEKKVEFLKKQRDEIYKQKDGMEQLSTVAGGLQGIFNSYNLSVLDKQINLITGKILELQNIKPTERTIDVIDKEIQDRKDDQKKTSTRSAYAEIEKKIKKLEAEKAAITGVKVVDKTADNELSKAKRYSEMINKIYEVNEKYTTKAMLGDEQKLADIRNEYKALQRDIDVYNSNPKNKKVNADLKPRLEKAIENQQYRNDTEKFQIELEKQKTLYQEYEEYKLAVGQTAADQRYAKELDVSVNYLQKLEAERAKLLAKDPTAMSGPEFERLKFLDTQINEQVTVERKKYDELVKELMSYEQQRRVLTENYNREFLELESKGTLDQRTELTKRFNLRLSELGDSHLKEIDAFKQLYAGIDRLSDENAKKVLANAETMLNSLKSKGVVISKELETELRNLFKDTSVAIEQRLPDRLINIAHQIDAIASTVGNLNGAFGTMLSTLSNVVGQVGNIKKGLDSFKDLKKGDVLGQLGAGLGILGAGISIFKTIASFFDRSKQREEQAAYARESQNKQTEALNKALERQVALLDKVYGTERITNYAIAIREANDLQAKYLGDLQGKLVLTSTNKELDDILTKINNGEKLKGDVGGTVKKYWLTHGQKLPQDIKSLQTLLDEGKLDANTATIVQNLIKANETAQQLANSLNQEVTGQSLDSIADAFISTLTDGVQDFGQSFESVIKKALLNGFKSKFIQDQLQGFYDKFADLSKNGLDDSEIEMLRKLYLSMGEEGKRRLEELQKITGVDLTTDDSNKGSLKGQLQADLTEQTGSLFLGVARATFEQGKLEIEAIREQCAISNQIFNLAVNHFNVTVKIEENTRRGADNTDGHTALLNKIVANTTPKTVATQTKSDLGL